MAEELFAGALRLESGVLKTVAGTNPAAGAEVSETVPAGKAWKLVAVSVQLVQGITQTPQPVLVLDDGTTVFFEQFAATNAQGASTTARYSWVLGGGPPIALVGATPNIRGVGPLPDVVLPAGFRVRTSTVGIGANTDYGAPALYVVEYG